VKKAEVVTYFFRDFDNINELYQIFEVLKVTGKIEEVNAASITESTLRRGPKA
jgi:hypothetical protein